ncbi:LuxR C-terminal-related transcriptional regulator [Nocardia sp. NPDC059240]|uniref:LuxR C-terminal-related transcriptional regulator n=1 Tax=Nocardia sp. NPDC059240 TaxID=3346786 RepID=UPI0036A56944
MLYGRDLEERRIGVLLDAAATGRSAALELVAEAGAGKTALLNRSVELAGESWKVLRCTGVEGESEFPFSGLQELLAAVGRPAALPLGALPPAQAEALRAVIGLTIAPNQMDRFLVGLATLSLLAELADEGPVLCVIDDVQWLDPMSAEALRFAARRLGTESIVMLFASRTRCLPGIAELHLPPLDDASSERLLQERWPGINPVMRERVLREASGNPLALLEFPRMDLDELPIGPLPLPYRLAGGYRRHVDALSEAGRLALLTVAAEPHGDPRIALQALDSLEVGRGGISEGEAAGLIEVSAREIRFRHPLVRAAVYHGSSFHERQSVHAALAAASLDDPDRRAWHLAAATIGRDESVAALLESAAERAVDRAGYSAASAAMERAAGLTPDHEIRGRRMVLATEWAAAAGSFQRAATLAGQAMQLPIGTEGRARLGWVQASVEFESGKLRRARDALLLAAEEVAAVEPVRAGPLFIEASRASWFLGDGEHARTARAKLTALRLPAEQRSALLAAIDGPLKLYSGELVEGIAIVRATVAEGHRTEDPALALVAAAQAMLIGDLEDARTLSYRALDDAQNQGMVGRFTTAAVYAGAAELMLGRLPEAQEIQTRAARVARDIGQVNTIASGQGYLALIAAIRGDDESCRDLIERSRRAHGQDNFIDVTHNEWALGLLDLGHGRYDRAIDRLDALYRIPNRIRGHWLHLLRDLVEAAVRAQQPERASEAMAEIERWAQALGSPFAEAIRLRSRGLLDSDSNAYREAAKLQVAEGLWYDYARTLLLLGELLRREREIGESRGALRQAVEIFDRLDALPWADHTRLELLAAGDQTPLPEKPTVKSSAALTPQELQVVKLAAGGATNKEIAAKLFLSPKTVAHHLYRAFPKLGVASRVELARLSSF